MIKKFKQAIVTLARDPEIIAAVRAFVAAVRKAPPAPSPAPTPTVTMRVIGGEREKLNNLQRALTGR
jgi:hypothetical protein